MAAAYDFLRASLLMSVVDKMNTNGLIKGFYYWNYNFLLVCLLLRRN